MGNIEQLRQRALIEKALQNLESIEKRIEEYDYDNIIVIPEDLIFLPIKIEHIPFVVFELNQITLQIVRDIREFINRNQTSIDSETLAILANQTERFVSTYPNIPQYEALELRQKVPTDLQGNVAIQDAVAKVLIAYVDTEKFADILKIKHDENTGILVGRIFFGRFKIDDSASELRHLEETLSQLSLEDKPSIDDAIGHLNLMGQAVGSIVGTATSDTVIDLYPNALQFFFMTFNFMHIEFYMRTKKKK